MTRTTRIARTLNIALATASCIAFAPLPSARAAGPAASAAQVEARKLSNAFVAVAERVEPAVVQIEVTSRDEKSDALSNLFGHLQDSPVAHGTGSGVMFTEDGAILTNNHVIDHALSIHVKLRDGRSFAAKLLGRDPDTDLAVIKVDGTGFTAARFADSEAARVGEWVVAIGSPFGLGYTVTSGVLSAKGRGGIGMNAIEDYLQTDASINPGNSGGPLCDLDGAVLGINTMIVGRGSGIGFAVPSNLARRVALQILKKGKVERAWIGVGIQDLTPELAGALKVGDARAGVLINSVTDGGPAQKANVKPGDVIVTVESKRVADGRELVREVISHDVGESIKLEIVREGKRYATTAVLASRPEAAIAQLPVELPTQAHAGLGLSLRDIPAAQASQMGAGDRAAVVITSVAAGSAADRAGLKTGDVIVEADGVDRPNAAKIAEAAKDGTLLVRVKRRESWFYAAVKR